MTPISTPRIQGQNEAYNKGLVLGLTMAEVGILIIFVLLLLLMFGEFQRAEVVRKFSGREPVEPLELSRLVTAESTLKEVAKALNISSEAPADDFERLVRLVSEASKNQDVKPNLTEAQTALEEIRRARTELQNALTSAGHGDTQKIVDQVEQQGLLLGNQEGQLRYLQAQLAAAGQGGKGERPCWIQPTGTIDFLYQVVLTSDGIRMREINLPHRAREVARSLMPRVNPEEILPPSVFLQRTAALYRYSRNMECRFFVIVYDATAPHEKPLYKELLRTVEGHFYKRLDNGAAPF